MKITTEYPNREYTVAQAVERVCTSSGADGAIESVSEQHDNTAALVSRLVQALCDNRCLRREQLEMILGYGYDATE